MAPGGRLTSVVLFIHRRAETTRRVFASISQYKPERLYIFADGARAVKDEESLVRSAREETENVDWDCEVFRHYSSENIGLSKSVLGGLDLVFQSESSAIILEDDCMPSPSFFPFAEKLLGQFEHSEEVAIISGTNLSGIRKTTDPYMFIGHPYIWGWATWANNWREFRNSPLAGNAFVASFRAIPGVFSKVLFWNLLVREKRLQSWAIPFAKHIHSKKQVCIVPTANLIENIGFGESATHSGLEGIFASAKAKSLRGLPVVPLSIERKRRIERQISKGMFIRLVKAVSREPRLMTKILKRIFGANKQP